MKNENTNCSETVSEGKRISRREEKNVRLEESDGYVN